MVIEGDVMDWGLNAPAVKVPAIAASPFTVKFFRNTALSKTFNPVNSVLPSATVKDWVRNNPSEINPDKAWMVLAVERRLSLLRVK